MIQLLLSLVPIAVSGGIIGMVVCDDIVSRAILAIPILGILAWQKIRLDL